MPVPPATPRLVAEAARGNPIARRSTRPKNSGHHRDDTLACGHGRAFFAPALAGIQWEKGAVGTARFTGTRLSEILKKAGVKTTGLNVEMHAADRPLGTMPAFVRQVPMAKAMHPDTIVAWDMNGQPIPAPWVAAALYHSGMEGAIR